VEQAPGPASDAVTLMKNWYETSSAMEAAVGSVLRELGLTLSQAEMLWALEPSTPPVPMRELARKLHFDPSNISLMTDRLVAAGLVERRPHPTDGRKRVPALTGKGLEVWALLIDQVRRRSPLFALAPEEQAQLSRLLEKAARSASEHGS